MKLRSVGILSTIRELTGNARACILTEPLWGIPFNLAMPFVSPYMKALGLTPLDIGVIGSVYLVMMVISSVLSGVLTDKFGRRNTTFIGDLLSWSIPQFLWMYSQNFNWFLLASIFNGTARITQNSWALLMVEDSHNDMIIKCNFLAQLMGMITVFISPLSGLAVGRFGVIPTMRFIYGMGFVMMTTKIIILYFISRETQIGEQRMKDTKNKSIIKLLLDCRHVFAHLLTEKRILLTMSLIAMFQIVSKLNEYFWSLYVIGSIGVHEGNLIWFTSLRSLVTLLCIILLTPRLRVERFKRPLLTGWGLFMFSQLMLILSPAGSLGMAMLVVSALAEGAALALIVPLTDSMLIVHSDPERRARINGLVYATILLPVALFPTIGGYLTQFTERAPFLINIFMLCVGTILTVVLARLPKKKEDTNYGTETATS